MNLPFVSSRLMPCFKAINFELMVSYGYDGIFLTRKGQSETRDTDPNLYGWDVESLLIFNPDIIIDVRKNIETGKHVPTEEEYRMREEQENKWYECVQSWNDLKDNNDNLIKKQHQALELDYEQLNKNTKTSTKSERDINFNRQEFPSQLNKQNGTNNDYEIKADTRPLNRKGSLNRYI